jgi:hypothetical protein
LFLVHVHSCRRPLDGYSRLYEKYYARDEEGKASLRQAGAAKAAEWERRYKAQMEAIAGTMGPSGDPMDSLDELLSDCLGDDAHDNTIR